MRPTLTIVEATSLLSACNLAQSALEQRLATAEKKNDFATISGVGIDYARLVSARRKIEIELRKATIPTPSEITKSEDA